MDDGIILKLDFLLNKMVENDSMVTANDLVLNNFYNGVSPDDIIKEFKYLQSFFSELDVARVVVTQDAELLDPTQKSVVFQRNGGFSEYYKKQNLLDQEYLTERKLRSEIDELTKINLELQNKELRTKIFYSIIAFLAGAILSNIKDIILAMKK